MTLVRRKPRGTPVTAGMVVTITYTCTVDGEVIEAGNDVQYLHGTGMLLSALERAIATMQEGQQRKFSLRPDDAYGHPDPENFLDVPRVLFPSDVEVKVGARLGARFMGEQRPFTVIEVTSEYVRCDFNHVLAGKTLHFNLLVKSVRPASTHEVFRGVPGPMEVV